MADELLKDCSLFWWPLGVPLRVPEDDIVRDQSFKSSLGGEDMRKDWTPNGLYMKAQSFVPPPCFISACSSITCDVAVRCWRSNRLGNLVFLFLAKVTWKPVYQGD